MKNTCKICKNEFKIYPYEKDRPTCSRACAGIYRGLKMKGKKHYGNFQANTQMPQLFKKGCVPWNKGIVGIMPSGEKHPMFGKRHSVETRKMISNILSDGRLARENHPNWIADRTKLAKKQERNDSAYGAWRKEVWLRDNFKCKIANPDCRGRIEAHHILGWTEYPELRYQLNNGITLCHAHHPRGRAKEKQLSPYFQSLVLVSK